MGNNKIIIAGGGTGGHLFPAIAIGEEIKDYNYGDNVFIPVEEVHRMENRISSLVKIIEVQIGSYLGEDDIVRLEDIYDR